ncbi:hypothetical protein C2G38_2083802 [Gigaspora rosea]|uniref:Uncharacterized protein n=1 Tax=Gigaspora rosea TaxID=44941 RepID=A0A397V9M4_9GLOM|nr:hypothetical protein C2G38_2083802 [Gigaspora rosea]
MLIFGILFQYLYIYVFNYHIRKYLSKVVNFCNFGYSRDMKIKQTYNFQVFV